MRIVKRVISNKVREKRPEKILKHFSINEFFEKRNKILIIRNIGGLGDIFMHRMIFEDFKLLMPDAEIHFCCPEYYHDAIKDHPYIDKILDYKNVNKNDYIVSYNTTTVCGRTEMKYAPLSGPNRSDIWANHCGLDLTCHNMHIQLTEEEKQEGKKIIESVRDCSGPCMLISPVSAMKSKNIIESQLVGLVEESRKIGLFPVCVHNTPIEACYKNNIPIIIESKIRNWMAIINQADYVVSVDTAAFHCAGGMGKPLVGIFAWSDGQVYGKYYDFFLVQKHRNLDPNWTCGPCYMWGNCPKSDQNPKPCLTEITTEMIMTQVNNMVKKWPSINYN